jgi:hypothetical protein
VDVIVPDRAMSAGTVLALSADVIMMDYFSVLGPIDPQVEKDGRLIPALAYLIQYNRLIEKAAAGGLTTADAILLQKLDLGELQQFEEARELSVSLLKKWLATYKFKDWTVTETRKAAVKPSDREERAADIATKLSDPQLWHSHGRGITMETLRNELNLRIDDFGTDPELARVLRHYLNVLRDYMRTREIPHFVHARGFF